MIMKKILIILSGTLMASSLSAQSLDPTVEVSRAYEGKLIEVHKPAIEMAVPDTVQSFDLKFDYSVFDSPYKGSFEFNPYMVEMRPAPVASDPSRFYLLAGAGYTLHPVFDLVWSPQIKGPFQVDVYGTHRSYVGDYRAVEHTSSWWGYDLLSKAGADFGYDWKKASLEFGASYYGVAVKDYLKKRSYDAVDAYVSLKSKAQWPKHFMYDIRAAYRYGEDRSSLPLTEHGFRLDARFGPRFDDNNRMFFDVGVELDAYSKALNATYGRFYFTPHYIYEKGIMMVDLGVCLAASMNSGSFIKNQIIYPDMKLNLKVIPEAMKMYLRVGGGEKLNTYASLVDSNHHLDLGYADPLSLVQPSVERVSAELGFEGRISGFFSYDLKGGYSNFKSAPFDLLLTSGEGTKVPGIGYAAYQKAYAQLGWDLNFQCVRFDGTVEYIYSWGFDNSSVLATSPLSVDAELVYNWRKRVYVGADCDFALARRNMNGYKVPGYVDLGVFAEYAVNRKFSVWLRGGNLLDMEIQRNLLFAEKGINFTAGICLSL